MQKWNLPPLTDEIAPLCYDEEEKRSRIRLAGYGKMQHIKQIGLQREGDEAPRVETLGA